MDDSRTFNDDLTMLKRLIHRLIGSPTARNMVAKIEHLSIKHSGVDDDGDPFVVLNDGTTFFGHQGKTYSPVYRLLSSETRAKLNKECMQVAADIVIRYVEGGLMYGGPKKQSRYVVKPGNKVSEMGAYEGFCSIKLAQQVGPEGRVVAIEPMAENFRRLNKNKDANGLTQLTTVNNAVWDSERDVEMQRRKGDGQSSSIEMSYNRPTTYSVRAETLDHIYQTVDVLPTDFMIIQLNGAEINALRGLTSFKPRQLAVAARYDTEGTDAAKAISNLLKERGYVVEIDEEDFVFASLA